MGNTPSGGGSYRMQLTKCASMVVSTSHGRAYSNGSESSDYEKKGVVYSVDDRTCTATITRCTQPGSSNLTKRFIITITDSDRVKSWRLWPYRFEMVVELLQSAQQQEAAASAQYLKVSHAKTGVIQDEDILWVVTGPALTRGVNPLNLYGKDAINNNSVKTVAPDGTITLTSLNLYRVQGNDKQKGLVVIQLKKKKKNINDHPFEVIVWHYFASLFKTQAGFSVVAKMRGGGGGDAHENNNGGNLQLDGPIIHPAPALFEMFDKVSRSGYWTPYTCPHCAEANTIINKQNNLPTTTSVDMRLIPNNNKPINGGGIKSLFNDPVQKPESESEGEEKNSKKSTDGAVEKSLFQPRPPSDGNGRRRDKPPNNPPPNGYVVNNYGILVNEF